MATFLETADCTRLLTEVWREWHMTRKILLCGGLAMAVSGFYIAATLPFNEHGPWIISACFVGAAGLLITAYAITLIWLGSAEVTRPNRRNASRSDSNHYLLFFSNSTLNQPDVCTVAPSTSRVLHSEANKV